MINETTQAIEAKLKEARNTVQVGEALERLRHNRDFKQVVLDGYFHSEAVRLVHLKAHPAFQTPEKQASIITQIDAIGSLHEYFRTVDHFAAQARKEIGDCEQAIEEIAAEELNNG